MQKFIQFLIIFACTFFQYGQSHGYSNWGQAFSVWPDTGQTACYDADFGAVLNPCPAKGQPFYGQDAQYSGSTRSYTKLDISGNDLTDSAASWAMVRDNVTGLIWEAKNQADALKDYNNPNDADNTYTWCSTNPGDGDFGTCVGFDTENDFLRLLNSNSGYAGYTDWRLPTINELKTLVDWGRVNPATSPTYFPHVSLSSYWSSTTGEYMYAWVVDFQTGYNNTTTKNNSYFVRAVRGGQVQPDDRFMDNGNGTVTDTVTCLQWQQATAGSMTWESALAYAENLSLGEYHDWRLPNINELTSIIDYSRIDPAVDPDVFPGTFSTYYWTSTTDLALMTYYAWVVSFSNGLNSDGDKSGNHYVRAVRGKGCGHFPWNLFLPAITNESHP